MIKVPRHRTGVRVVDDGKSSTQWMTNWAVEARSVATITISGGMAECYTGSYLDRSNGWRAVATLADISRASLVGSIPKESIRTLPGRRQQDSVLINRG